MRRATDNNLAVALRASSSRNFEGEKILKDFETIAALISIFNILCRLVERLA